MNQLAAATGKPSQTVRLRGIFSVRTFFYVLVGAVFIAAPSLFGNLVTLDEVLQHVSQNHPYVLSARQELKIAEANYVALHGRFDTVLSARQDYSKRRSSQTTLSDGNAWTVQLAIPFKSGITLTPAFSQNTVGTGATSAFLYLNIPLLRDNKSAQSHYLEYAYYALESAENAYLQQLAISMKESIDLYLDWVLLDQHVQISKTILDWTQMQEKRLKELVIARTKPVSDYDAIQAELALKKSTLAELIVQKKKLENQIQYIMGNAGNQDVTQDLIPEYVEPTTNLFEAVIPEKKEVLDRRYDVLALQNRVEAMDHQARLQKMYVWPRLDLNLSVGQDRYDDRFSNLFSSNDQNNYSYSVGVQTELPLQNRVRKGSYSLTEAQHELAQFQLEQLKRQITMDVDLSYRQVTQTLGNVVLKRQTREHLVRSRDSEEKRFHAGVSTLTEMLSRQFRLEDAQYEEVSAVIAYYKALNLWSYQIGTVIQRVPSFKH